MNPTQARRSIRVLAGAGNIRFTAHARFRMRERDVGEREVRRLLVGAVTCRPQENGRWRVAGAHLVVVVVIERDAVVVTLFRGDEDEDGEA